MTENEISKIVLDAAIEVHRTLGGPGLLENVYEEALAYELGLRGLQVKRKHRGSAPRPSRQLRGEARERRIPAGSQRALRSPALRLRVSASLRFLPE